MEHKGSFRAINIVAELVQSAKRLTELDKPIKIIKEGLAKSVYNRDEWNPPLRWK
jgi:hypothetical protein